MSRETVELLRSLFASWNRGDLEPFLTHLADDIVWLEVKGRPERLEGVETRGRESLRTGLESLFDAWEEYRLEPQEIHDLGDRLVAVLREVARGRGSGIEVDSLWGYVITMRAGQIARVDAYRDPAEAFEAAGLSP
jgi:ketosteroid isomerase-like protein